MPYRVRCKECREFIYILEIIEQRTNYPCPSCNFDNVFDKKQSAKFFGVEEIKVEDFPNYDYEVKKTTLSYKYSILDIYKGLAYLMMIVSTGFFIYGLVQFVDAPKEAREILKNAMITSTVSYVITMFSLFCLTKIIDFLFDLDKKTN